MLSKLQKLREEREQGFTLIELLVVILIIGILAAIAIPAFLNQRKSAVDSSVESDARNVATAVETAAVAMKGQPYTLTIASNAVTLTASGATKTEAFKLSNGTTISVTDKSSDGVNGWAVTLKNTGGDRASKAAGISYKSNGGLTDVAITDDTVAPVIP